MENGSGGHGDGNGGPKTVWGAAVRWLFGQEANTVLLFVIVGMLGAGAYYGLPQLLRSIQSGYELLDNAHTQQLEAQRSVFRDSLKEQAQTYEKTMQRTADSFDKAMDRAMQGHNHAVPSPITPPRE